MCKFINEYKSKIFLPRSNNKTNEKPEIVCEVDKTDENHGDKGKDVTVPLSDGDGDPEDEKTATPKVD